AYGELAVHLGHERLEHPFRRHPKHLCGLGAVGAMPGIVRIPVHRMRDAQPAEQRGRRSPLSRHGGTLYWGSMPSLAGAGTGGADTPDTPPRTAAFAARHSRQECQACGAISVTTSTMMVTVAYRETSWASVTPSLPSRYPPNATTEIQAAEPSVSHSTNASSGSPAHPAAA